MHKIWTDFKTTPYLAAEDLGGEEVVFTIAEVVEGGFTDDKDVEVVKPVLVFAEKWRGKDKRLAVNVTNRAVLQDIFGDDVQGCIGEQITVYPTTTQYKGKVVPCLRIKEAPETPDDDVAVFLAEIEQASEVIPLQQIQKRIEKGFVLDPEPKARLLEAVAAREAMVRSERGSNSNKVTD